MLQRILQKSAFSLHNTYIHTSGVNKHNMYIADKRSCNMLKLAAKFGFVTDLLYIALYHYKTFFSSYASDMYVDPIRAQAALDDLQVLVHHDQGLLVPVKLGDISWEILGIYQQMTGNHQAALYSYRQSLSTQIPVNKIQAATRHRIQELH